MPTGAALRSHQGGEEQALRAVADLTSPARFIFERLFIVEKRLLLQRVEGSDGPELRSFSGGEELREELAGREGSGNSLLHVVPLGGDLQCNTGVSS